MRNLIIAVSITILLFFSKNEILSKENSYNNSFKIGLLKENPDNLFYSFGVTKQYMFYDFTLGVDFNLLFLGQNKFEKLTGLTLAPKLGMVIYGDDKSSFFLSLFTSSGISNANTKKSSSFGYVGSFGVETRYLNYGASVSYANISNKLIDVNALTINLHYWF